MPDDCQCFHSRTTEQQEPAQIAADTIVEAVVACRHVYGLGVYVPKHDVWGHVNVTAMRVESIRENSEYHPAVGQHLTLRVLGRAGGQLRLAAAD